VIISESLARYASPDSAALGKRLKFGAPDSAAPWMTVVGIVRDVRYRDREAPPPALYVPLRQSQFPARFLIVRESVEKAAVLSIAQRHLKELDPSEPVMEAASIAELLARQLRAPRFHMVALGLFAAVAVLLAAVGVFGVLGAFVAERSREMGLRIALGANLTDVRRLVLAKMGWPAALGLTAGTCAAFAAAPLLRPLVFRISVVDPGAFAAGWIALTLAILLATIVPLRRAASVDPVALLRLE
jgi:putative ABC transport system permease protein